jgi:hypothetical protein
MTPGEVQALQQMAVQHGGSLTINPHTGLPEAGFLGDILSIAAPIALNFIAPGAGAALGSFVTGGAATGALATGLGMGLISGGLTALTTGDLSKGLTAGLTSGLVGGAMASFNPAAASTAAAPTANAATAVPAVEAAKAAQVSMMQNPSIINPGVNPVGSQIANAQSAINATAVNPVGATVANRAQAAANVPGVVNPPPAQKGIFDTLGDKWTNLSTPGKLGVGAAGLGLLSAMAEKPGVKVPVDKGTIRPYTYTANKVSPYPGFNEQGQQGPMYDESGNAILDKQENRYYNPSYTALPTYEAAQGGLMSAPFGSGNDMYPQSQQEHTNFATPTQMPTSAEVVNADYEMKSNPFTGSPTGMAKGGIAGYADGGTPQARNISELSSMAGALPRDSSPTGNMSYPNGGAGWGYNLALQQLNKDPADAAPQGPAQYTYDPKLQKYNIVEPVAPAAKPADYGMMNPIVSQMNAQQSGAGDKWAEAMMPFGGGMGFRNTSYEQPQQFSDGLFGKMFSQIIPELVSGDGSNQYQYNPQTQQYVHLAEGGDITEGYKGYGQQNQGGRNPIELLKALSAKQPEPTQTTVVRQAHGGLSTLGGYSDGGRMLKGPGDGMSDNIPATIGGRQPARLADGEFVVPADVVSHLGNGSTDAGAKRLYSMMDKVRQARTGNKKQGKQIKAEKYLPA